MVVTSFKRGTLPIVYWPFWRMVAAMSGKSGVLGAAYFYCTLKSFAAFYDKFIHNPTTTLSCPE